MIFSRIKIIAFSLLFAFIGLCGISYGQENVKIAVVVSSSIAPYNDSLKGFNEKLKESGVEYSLFRFYMDEASSEKDLIAAVRDISPHIIHTVGTSATRLVKTEIEDIPVVFSMVLNPVSSGLVKGMKASGNHLTGASMDIPLALQFRYAKMIVPGLKRIGVIYSKEETRLIVDEAKKVAAEMGIELLASEVTMPGEVPRVLRSMKGEIDLLWSVADSNVFTRETVKEVLLITLQNKLPFMGLSPAFVKAGALFALHSDAVDIGRQAALITKKIIFGQSPGSIPIDVPDKVQVFINKNTVDTLKLRIPRKIYKSAEVIR